MSLRPNRPITDTSRDVEEIQLELFRKAPPWRKLELVDQLNQSVKLLALSGLRKRHPNATEKELRRKLADLILGEELAFRVYGKSSASE